MQVAVILKDGYNNKVIVLALRKGKKKSFFLRKAIINCQVTKFLSNDTLFFISFFKTIVFITIFVTNGQL